VCHESLHRVTHALTLKSVRDTARASRFGSDGRPQKSLQDLRTDALRKKRDVSSRAPESAKGTSGQGKDDMLPRDKRCCPPLVNGRCFAGRKLLNCVELARGY
jgi:hypothetical protein